MKIIIEVDAAELSEDLLAQIIARGKPSAAAANTNTEATTQKVAESTTDDPADRKAEIAARLDELGVPHPKKGSRLTTWEKTLEEAEAAANTTPDSDPVEEETSDNDSWDDSEEAEEAKPDYTYEKTHALAKIAVQKSELKGGLIRKILDNHVGEGVGLQKAFEEHADKIPAIVADLEKAAGCKYE